MSIDDELQRRFDRASTAIDLDPGSVDGVRARAAKRGRSRTAIMAVAAAVVLVIGGFGLRSLTEPAVQELEIASVGDPAVDVATGQLSETDLTYLGAFLAPAGDVDGTTFAFGGQAAAFNPIGNSLFLTSHPRQNMSVGEITIPEPQLHNGETAGLPIAELLGSFGDITGGRGLDLVGSQAVGGLDEFRYGGLEVVDGVGGPRLHWSIYQYINVSEGDLPGHGHSSLDLANPDPHGPWHLGDLDNRLTAGYLFNAPDGFDDPLITGFRGGPATIGRSWAPPFYGYTPPTQAEPGTRLDATVLAPNRTQEQALAGFGQADTAAGAAWLTTADGANAIVTVGFRGLGEVIQGEPREQDCGINTSVHAGPYEPLVMFYDPTNLLEPYRTWNPAEHLIPTCLWELTSISFDAETGRVYIVQREADTSQNEFSPVPVIHVFQL